MFAGPVQFWGEQSPARTGRGTPILACHLILPLPLLPLVAPLESVEKMIKRKEEKVIFMFVFLSLAFGFHDMNFFPNLVIPRESALTRRWDSTAA